MTTGTVRLHRVLRAPPERVYRALIDADAMAKWLPPDGFTGRVHHLDARVGGSYRMSFTNFSTGQSTRFGGEYLEMVPGARLRRMDCPALPPRPYRTASAPAGPSIPVERPWPDRLS